MIYIQSSQVNLQIVHSLADDVEENIEVVIFSRVKTRRIPNFVLGENELEVVTQNKYLGLTFNYNGKFTTAKNNLYEKGNRAMFALLCKSRQLQLPIDVQLYLFDALVKLVLLYGCC